MAVFTSPSDQDKLGFHEHGHTFASLVVDAHGACIAAERVAKRDVDAKGLLVRYPNPFAGGGPPEVLYEVKDALVDACQDTQGAWYAVSTKKLHTNATGSW